jgi:hypothetical protein
MARHPLPETRAMRLERAQSEIAERVSQGCVVSTQRLSAFAARMADLEVKCEMRLRKYEEALSLRPSVRAD